MRTWCLGGAGWLATTIGSLACQAPANDLSEPTGQLAGNVAVTDVTVLDLVANRLDPDRTILIRDGRITTIGPTGSVPIPPGARRIDAAGQVVMSPLADLHAHSLNTDRLAYVGYGIATVRIMWGTPDQQALAAAIGRGELIGPDLFLASPGHDGQPASWPLTRFVLTLEAAEPAVALVEQEGWDFLKIYDRLDLTAYRAILGAARRRDIGVVGHLPFAVDLHEALALGQRSIEHLSGYEAALTGRLGPNPTGWAAVDQAKMPALALETARSATWNCPTLAITGAIARRNWSGLADQIVRGRRAMVKALSDAGARLLIGSDAGIDIVPPGRSLIMELREFVAAGIPTATALRIATADAAEFLGQAAQRGTLEVGKQGNLLFLSADPRSDLGILEQPTGLLLNGRLFDRAALEQFRNSAR